MKVLNLFIFPLLILCSFSVNAQTAKKRPLVQFSGIVVAGDSLEAIPFCSITVKGSNHGTISDYYGYFSFVAQTGDTIIFSSVGYNKGQFTIPDSLTNNKYSLIHMLSKDTIMLPVMVIYPWPTKEQFKEAFMNLSIPDDDMDNARANLYAAERNERYENTGMDAKHNNNYVNQQRYNKLYYAGQYPPNNLLNPIAWSNFIKAWKKGDLKKKDPKYKYGK